MQRKGKLAVLIIVLCGSFAAAAAVPCNDACQAHAMTVGDKAAHSVMFAELSQDGKLGQLIRAQVGLDVCGSKGKSKAISKLRDARFDEVIGNRLKKGPLGSLQDSEEEQHIQFASFLSAVQALQLGYVLGYAESTKFIASTSMSTKKAMCQAFEKLGDTVLFGDGEHK